jgi:hypothetical protein
MCTTFHADAKGPQPFIINMDGDLNRQFFANVMNEGIHETNVVLRQELDNIQSKFEVQDRVHEAVLAHNRSLEKHNSQLNATVRELTRRLTISEQSRLESTTIAHAGLEGITSPNDDIPSQTGTGATVLIVPDHDEGHGQDLIGMFSFPNYFSL